MQARPVKDCCTEVPKHSTQTPLNSVSPKKSSSGFDFSWIDTSVQHPLNPEKSQVLLSGLTPTRAKTLNLVTRLSVWPGMDIKTSEPGKQLID